MDDLEILDSEILASSIANDDDLSLWVDDMQEHQKDLIVEMLT